MLTEYGNREYKKDELEALIIQIKALVYARVSTQDQAKHGYSLESQVERCVKHAYDKFGYKEDEILVIIESGESGDNPDRPALNHVLFLVEKGIGKKVIMLHPNRMSRYLALQTEVSQSIWGAGVDIEFVEFEVDPNNPESMLMFNIQGSIAQYNKAKILADSRRGRMQKIKNGQISGMRRLYGYTFDKENDILIENEEEKEIYLKMVDWYLNGKDGVEMSFSSIAESLSKEGVQAPLGNVWFSQTVSRMLQNEVYTGVYYYGKTEVVQNKGKKHQEKRPKEEWHKIKIPSYIIDETYEAIMAKVDQKRKLMRGAKPKTPYLLKGIVRCGRCGCAAVAAPASRSKQTGEITHHYYGCNNKAKRSFEVNTGNPNKMCRGRNWRKDMVDEYVWEYLIDKLQNPEKILSEIASLRADEKRIENLIKRKEQLEKKLNDKTKQRERYIEMFAMGVIKSKEELQKKIEVIDNELKEVNEDFSLTINTLDNISITYDKAELLKDNVRKFKESLVFSGVVDDESKQSLIRVLVQKVILYDDKIEIYTNWNVDAKGNHNSNVSEGDGSKYAIQSNVHLSKKNWKGKVSQTVV